MIAIRQVLYAPHAEGQFNTASGSRSHAEGFSNRSDGSASHAEGEGNVASATASHAEGSNNIVTTPYSHVQGRFGVLADPTTVSGIAYSGRFPNAEERAGSEDVNLVWKVNQSGDTTQTGTVTADAFMKTDGTPITGGGGGEQGEQGPQGIYDVKLYSRVVHGATPPSVPSARYDGTTLSGISSGWQATFFGGDVDDDTYDYYESFASYNPATEILGGWNTPFKIGNEAGPAGAKGDKGDKGDQGETGVGEQGPQGDPGETGIQGPKGDKGERGDRGPIGLTGPQGIQGEQGERGDTGRDGLTGPVGATGPQGVAGPKGDRGDTGPAGSTGAAGAPGRDGRDGRDGDKGDPGEQGIKGDKGDQGEQGIYPIQLYARVRQDATAPATPVQATYNGTTIENVPSGWQTGFFSSLDYDNYDYYQSFAEYNPASESLGQWATPYTIGSLGPTGPAGPKGNPGPQGERGVAGPKGDKGDTGERGVAGPTGPKGDKGDQGIQGLRGEAGATGTQGPKGDTGAQGLRGETGPRGDKGDKGDDGEGRPPQQFALSRTFQAGDTFYYGTQNRVLVFLVRPGQTFHAQTDAPGWNDSYLGRLYPEEWESDREDYIIIGCE